MQKRLITSALPYVNNIPHLGNIVGSLLSADVFARYCRSQGHATYFVCGTDEYGTATEMKALKENKTPQEICDHFHKIHKEIYDWFQIQCDAFGRTSTPEHTQFTQALFQACDENGFIGEQTSEQHFDEQAQMFLADRYLVGICPYCQFPKANADQCDQCGKLLSADELLEIQSTLSQTVPIKKKSSHLTLLLPQIEDQLKVWLEKASPQFSANANAITQAWIKEGLQQRTITRDLKWGVLVPKEGFTHKVFYVWFDAPIGYISITAAQTEDWKSWWQSDARLYQFMGKDNVPFHTILFPSVLLASRQKWTLPHQICATEYLNFQSEKFSKSRGVGVFGLDAVNSGIPSDYWRYYLMAIRPEQNDTNFLWSEFQAKINNELVANFGNLVNRLLVFLQTKMQGVVPFVQEKTDLDLAFEKASRLLQEEIMQAYEAVHLKEALHKIMTYARLANKYFQDAAPWTSIKKDPVLAQTPLFLLLTALSDLAICIEPFLPTTAQKLFALLGVAPRSFRDLNTPLISGTKLLPPTALFFLLEDTLIAELESKFKAT